MRYFSESENDHKAFHAILNKYIPEKPGRTRDRLLTYLDGLPERQKREYYVKAMEQAYDDFGRSIDADALRHYKEFMKQVKTKLRTKIDISENEVNKVVKQFIQE